MEANEHAEAHVAANRPGATLSLERARFTSLLLSNPNYFGNLKVSPYKPVTTITGNTTYEELKCVGYHPDLNLLKAVVWVKLDSGYSGGICTAGSQEYVRFYISFDNGTTWQDQGMVSFSAYDLPGDKPLEFAVTVQPQNYWTWCFREELPLVRAILSWSDPITGPDFIPVWGNVVESHIQIHPVEIFYLGDLLKEAKIAIPQPFEGLIDPTQQIKAPAAKALNASDLLALYKDKGVHEHRFLFPEVQKHLANPALLAAYKAYGSNGSLADLAIDLGAIIGLIEQTDGDTTYEQLDCVGLDPVSQENLVGILEIKRPYGYSGGQCDAGSQEYVAFWVDWEDGSGWNWVGTAQVNVHDFGTIPSDGLAYAVAQPINLVAHRKPCEEGAVTARVRAILSWSTPPPSWDPDYTPTWGNRVETRIHIYPGPTVLPGDYTPYLEGLCGVASCSIDQTTGFAPGDRPFGGSTSIYGYIPGAPDRSIPPLNRLKYRLSVRSYPGGLWQHLNDSFGVTLEEQVGAGMPTSTPLTQSVDANDYYTYQDAPPVPGIGWRAVYPSHLLGVWNTSGKTGLWEIMVEALDPVTNVTYVAGTMLCVADGTTRQNVIVDLDNAIPVTSLAITHVSHDGGATWTTAGDCSTFQVGDIIRGSYSVSDEHFGSLALPVQPSAHANGATVSPSTPTSYPAAPTTGVSGIWTLNTAGMDPCGYTIQLQTNDRTIVGCVSPWRNDSAFVGFCLEAAPVS